MKIFSNGKPADKRARQAKARFIKLLRASDGYESALRATFDLMFGCVTLSEQVKLIFCDILIFYKKLSLRQELTNETLVIAKGIIESLEIKIESLDEVSREFEDESKLAIQKIKRVTPDLSAIEAALEPTAFNDSADSDNSNAHVLNEAATNTNELRNRHRQGIIYQAGHLIREFREKRAAIYKKYVSDAEKKRERYLKNSLLFEIITFDEMLMYSVSHLSKSSDKSAQEFAAYIRVKSDQIQVLLSEFGISAIEPRPHDMFSGREHEALLAERKPDFSRGEVIMLHNKGYRMGDVVLVRANVIAAR